MVFKLSTPVAFIIFNRPETTEKVFQAIRKAEPPKLLVIADGPREDHPEDIDKCAETLAIIDQVDWDCEVLINYAESNMGCKRRVSSGLDWVFDMVEESIILEDDCLPQQTFFQFSEKLLERYRDDKRVMMISGTNLLLKWNISDSYLFSRYCFIWGWATWKRAWEKYDINLEDWEKLKAQKQLNYFFPWKSISKYFCTIFDAVQSDCIDTWDYQWFYSCLFNNGLCIVPKVNLISNIGADGTHISLSEAESDPNLFLPVYALNMERLKHPNLVFGNFLFDAEFSKKKLSASLINRVKAKLLYNFKKVFLREKSLW
jgi:hypothetical protein